MSVGGPEVPQRDVGDQDLHHRVRDAIRKAHAKCDPSTCALAHIWAEDVAEVLDAARAARSVLDQQDDEPPRRAVVEQVSGAALAALITEALAWEDSPVVDHPQRAAIGDFLTGWFSGADHRVIDGRTWQRIQERARLADQQDGGDRDG